MPEEKLSITLSGDSKEFDAAINEAVSTIKGAAQIVKQESKSLNVTVTVTLCFL